MQPQAKETKQEAYGTNPYEAEAYGIIYTLANGELVLVRPNPARPGHYMAEWSDPNGSLIELVDLDHDSWINALSWVRGYARGRYGQTITEARPITHDGTMAWIREGAAGKGLEFTEYLSLDGGPRYVFGQDEVWISPAVTSWRAAERWLYQR